MSTVTGAELVAPALVEADALLAVEADGLVTVLPAADAADDPVVVVVVVVVVLSGPVRKKLPATGLPSPVCAAKAEMLNPLTGVEALTMLGTT